MAFQITLTTAGIAAIVNAENTGTAPVTVSQIGVTATAFAPAVGLTALPGELKRISTFGGLVVADDTIHVTLQDSSADTYTLRGFGLYLADGTLFAVYGQAGAILEKSTQSIMLLATDVKFTQISATSITFGSTDWINPPATTEVQGVVELATASETITGTDSARAVVPSGLKAAMDNRLGAAQPSSYFRDTFLGLTTAAAIRFALALKGAALKDEGAGNSLDADLLDGQHGSYYRAWANLTGVPATFAPSAHNQDWSTITGKPETATRWPAWGEVTSKPATFPPDAHSQDWSTILSKPATATRWPDWTEVTGKPGTFPPSGHGHLISDVSGLQGALDAKASLGANVNFSVVSANGFATPSDRRYKKAIARLNNCLGVICRIQPREFEWKDGRGWDTGYIAQELRQVLPHAVEEFEDDEAEDTRMFIKPDKVTPYLVGAVQELLAKIEAQDKRIKALEAK